MLYPKASKCKKYNGVILAVQYPRCWSLHSCLSINFSSHKTFDEFPAETETLSKIEAPPSQWVRKRNSYHHSPILVQNTKPEPPAPTNPQPLRRPRLPCLTSLLTVPKHHSLTGTIHTAAQIPMNQQIRHGPRLPAPAHWIVIHLSNHPHDISRMAHQRWTRDQAFHGLLRQDSSKESPIRRVSCLTMADTAMNGCLETLAFDIQLWLLFVEAVMANRHLSPSNGCNILLLDGKDTRYETFLVTIWTALETVLFLNIESPVPRTGCFELFIPGFSLCVSTSRICCIGVIDVYARKSGAFIILITGAGGEESIGMHIVQVQVAEIWILVILDWKR